MATIPTKNPIPSELPRDLKFNAGKIDEFVTSSEEKYSDRFGTERYTISGINSLAQRAISSFGYVTVDSFEDGATLTLPNQVLRLESTGDYYRWDGEYPKVVPSGSTPASSGGVGKGAWLSVADTTLRSQLASVTGSALVGAPDQGIIEDMLYWRTPGQFSNGTSFTMALQYAINANKKVIIPQGEFSLISGITVPEGHSVSGCGIGATILNIADDIKAFTFVSGRGGKVSDMNIIYSSSNGSGDGITVPDEAFNVEVNNIYMVGPYNGIVCGNNQGSKFENIDIWYYKRAGIFINDNFNDSFFSKIFLNGAVYQSSTIGPGVGILASGKAHAMFFRDVEIIQSASPMQLFGSSPANILTCAFSFFFNCFFDSSTGPVVISNSRAISFIGCWFSNRDTGVSITSSVDTIFDSCRFINSDAYGAIIQANCKNTTFTGCVFDSNGQSSAGTYYGIVSNPTTELMISGCTFGNLGTFSPTQHGGVRLVPGNYDRVSIHDNNFSATLSAPGIRNEGTITNYSVKNNFGYKTQNKGQGLVPSGTVSFAVAHELSVTPSISDIMLTFTSGKAGVSDFRVSAADGTSFTVSLSPAPTANISFAWLVNAEDR